MRFSLLASPLLSCLSLGAALGQQAPATRPKPTERLAVATAAAAAPTIDAAALASCTVLTGQVLDENGRPLVGATVSLAGTSHINSTNADGFFMLTRPLKPWQRLRFSAAGYADVERPVDQCHLAPVTLRILPGTRVKQGRRHYGKVMKVGSPAGRQAGR